MENFKVKYISKFFVDGKLNNKTNECYYSSIQDISNAFGLTKREIENFYTAVKPKKVDCVILSIEKLEQSQEKQKKLVVFN